MVFKWTLVAFGIAAGALAFMSPPRRGRPEPPLVRRVERALRWTLLVPLAIAVVLLVLALGGRW